MTNLIRYNPPNVDDVLRLSDVLAKSGMFADARQGAQAAVKILAGREMGFGEIASMTGIHVINGRVSIGANLMAAAVKKSGKYDYRVLQMDESACEIEYFQGGQSIGKSKFTLADARKAGTKNLDKYPRNMLFARAMSNGVRWYCPDALGGAPVYTPEELGAETDEEGNVISVEATPVAQEQPVTVPAHICEMCKTEVNPAAAAATVKYTGKVLCAKHYDQHRARPQVTDADVQDFEAAIARQFD